MNEKEAKELLDKILDDLKIEAGDVVYLVADMSKIPLPDIKVPLKKEALKQRQKDWCDFVLNCVLERITPEGTLLMGAASNAYARHGTPYIHEETPSEVSPLNEHFRLKEGVLRSFHPLLSVCGYGKDAEAILSNTGRSGFGIRSPYGKLANYPSKMLFLGVNPAVMTYAYNLQQMAGVNHMYHKIFNTPAFKDGKEVPGPWLAFLRFLDDPLVLNLDEFLEIATNEGSLNRSTYTDGEMASMSVADIDRIGYALLDENPWAFAHKKVEYHITNELAAEQSSKHAGVTYIKAT